MKKLYSTPEGLQYAASRSFSNASLALIANMIWQFLLQMLNVSGITSMILGFVGFALLFYGAISALDAFGKEIQADAIANEQSNRSLQTMKKLVTACIVIRALLAVVSICASIIFDTIKGSPAYRSIDALINIFGNIFTSVNILGIYAYQLFIKEGHDNRIKLYSLISFITVIVHFLLAELRYILLVFGTAVNVLSYAALIASVISYFSLFLLFEARKALYKPQKSDDQ